MAESSPKKPKLDNIKDTLKSSFDQLDTNLKAALYHISKTEIEQGVNEVEKTRRLMQAASRKAQFLIDDIRMTYAGAIQNANTLNSRNTQLHRANVSLRTEVSTLKAKVRSLSDLLGETLDDSLSDELFSSQGESSVTQDLSSQETVTGESSGLQDLSSQETVKEQSSGIKVINSATIGGETSTGEN